jgi:hypothetical protein
MSYPDWYPQPLGNAPLAQATSDLRVAEAQTLLNNMGYGPLKVDGVWGPNTKRELERALQQSYAGVDANALEGLRKLSASGHRAPAGAVRPPSVPPVTGPVNSGLVPETPVWKKPLVIGLGVAAAAAILFFVVKNETKVFSGSPEGAAGRRGRGRRLANGDAMVRGDDVLGNVGDHAKLVEGEVLDREPNREPLSGKTSRRKCRKTPEWT